ncbi:hypothetical protein [Pseudomonas sp. Ga0074129]|uniref:hypothetical protein n=1 Tax=Pseudomonas sp. Ga0074129 TaxID=1752219 RepID=UPI000AEFB17F|nr:hypothetical protein [Pseudomonas sp. Ga0074129]
MSYVFVLGAGDPEMSAIERVSREHNYIVLYASVQGQRVHAGNAYQADPIDLQAYPGSIPVWVECRSKDYQDHHVVIDHHHAGDPGYGFLPNEYWLGSSIGQLCALIGHDRTDDLSITAAADHCLSHAYKGLCPGVSPDALRKWRAKTRAQFQRIPLEKLESQVEQAILILRDKPMITINGEDFIDAREGKIKEFSEAAAIIGESVMYELYDFKSKRIKVGVLGGESYKIVAWLKWAEKSLVDTYGDPQRGYAGGYRK